MTSVSGYGKVALNGTKNSGCSCVIWFVSGRGNIFEIRAVIAHHPTCMYPTRLRVRVRAPPPTVIIYVPYNNLRALPALTCMFRIKSNS